MNETEKDIDYIVWDIETTGFVAPACSILEIACFIVRGNEIEEKHWVFNNMIDIPQKITEITGITKEIIDAEGGDPMTHLMEFLPLFKRCKKNITHNGVKFDIPFLIDYSAHILGFKDEEKVAVKNLIRSTAFDTAVHFKSSKLGMKAREGESFVQFAERVMNTFAKGVYFNLGVCCDESGISREGIKQHRALADVFLTHEVYKKITA